jgi:pimeloyl-ACP methyl ester carboxylesterase
MPEIQHRSVTTNGITMHYAEAGAGPLVVMLHGFPESWYSWRHQLTALAAAGYHAVAPDQRGYGQTSAPEAIDAYTQFHLVGDIVGLLDALGEQKAVVVGHDWGAPVAWHCALLRPDRFRAVIGLSVPFRVGGLPTTAQFKAMFKDNFFYILYFQEPGKAEAELDADPERTLRMVLYSASGDSNRQPGASSPLPRTAGFLDAMRDPETLPPWLSQADLDYFAGEFKRTGFRGGLNWYRNIDRNQALFGAFSGMTIHQPALFISGTRDVVPMTDEAKAGIRADLPNLRDLLILEGAGHWTQQERPAEVNEAMIGFLKGLP